MKINKKIFSINNKGYTLIEVIVAASIFFIVIAGPTGLFISSLKSQVKLLALREIIDNSSHVFDYITRSLRMARKELNCIEEDNPITCFCLKDSGYGFNYEVTRQGKGIKFNGYQEPGVCNELFLDINDNRFKELKNGGFPVPLTSDDLDIKLLEVKSFGESQEDDIQPRITMVFEITKRSDIDFPRLRVQTTVSQRNLDVTY